MAKFLPKDSNKIGAAPGSLIFVGNKKTEEVSISALRYSPASCETFEELKTDDLPELLTEKAVTWIDIYGLHDIEIIRELGDIFGIHPLMQEDVLNTGQRAKYEEFSDQNTFILKMLNIDSASNNVEAEQVSIIAGKNYVICFQEARGDVFDSIRNRIINQTTKIRERGSDYLAFALLDAIVDNYIVSIEFFGNEIENLETELLVDVKTEHLQRVNAYKKEINVLRRFVRPVLEMAFQYEKSESSLITDKTIPFIKDLQDHTTQAAEAIEIYKELLNDILAIYHNTMSSRLNDTIRILTVFSVIFIPLSFLAGVYGTNFQYFPELEYKYAYPVFWAALISIASIMLYYFHRKKWL